MSLLNPHVLILLLSIKIHSVYVGNIPQSKDKLVNVIKILFSYLMDHVNVQKISYCKMKPAHVEKTKYKWVIIVYVNKTL